MRSKHCNRRFAAATFAAVFVPAGSLIGASAVAAFLSQEGRHWATAVRRSWKAHQVIAELLAELDPQRLVDWSLRIGPSAQYHEYLEGKPDVSVTPRVSVILQPRFSEKPVAAARHL